MPASRCLYCGAPLHPDRTRRAVYCDSPCRALMGHLFRRQFDRLPASIERLFHALRKQAPAEATGYQLLLNHRGTVYCYPSSRRPWTAFDGQRSQRAAFRLYPFEIPIVPLPTLYGVQLVTPHFILPLPPALERGVRLDPVRPCRVEEGEVIP